MISISAILASWVVLAGQVDPIGSLPTFPASQRATYLLFERDLQAVTTAERLKKNHTILAARPHVAGTKADLEMTDNVVSAFKSLGLEVRLNRVGAYLPMLDEALVQIAKPMRLDIEIKEPVLEEDRYTNSIELMPGWNAWSGSGEIAAEVVYANYATKADFAQLVKLGVDVKGKIVLARYGGLFRGYKARFAQDAGAAGLILFSDPADSGFVKGPAYPEGGYFNEHSIERGSILTLAYPGDPLTPFVEANMEAKRLDPSQVDLPKILVQPIGWGGAREIISRMTGTEVLPEGWKGGIPTEYRVTGGPELVVRLKVKQTREQRTINNVVAQLPGTFDPQRSVIIGCHHDAWGYGASDPTSGTIVLVELARAFGLLASENRIPMRQITFAAWGAEEYGMIGSTEWVEGRREFLSRNAVAYINLDMASMGTDFGASTTPSLRRVIADATKSVRQARDASGRTVFDAWLARQPGATEADEESGPFVAHTHDGQRLSLGDLGGGSDHLAFLAHVGIPSMGISAGGSAGVAYHSNYDTLTWYQKVVGEDYAPALMVTRVTMAVAARLATSPLIPYDHSAVAPDMRRHMDAMATRAGQLGFDPRGGTGMAAITAAELFPRLNKAVAALDLEAGAVRTLLDSGMEHEWLDWLAIRDINNDLIAAERAWVDQQGLPDRPWYRNLYAAPDPEAGYAAWILPGLRLMVERSDAAGLAAMEERYVAATERVTAAMKRIQTRALKSMKMIKQP